MEKAIVLCKIGEDGNCLADYYVLNPVTKKLLGPYSKADAIRIASWLNELLQNACVDECERFEPGITLEKAEEIMTSLKPLSSKM